MAEASVKVNKHTLLGPWGGRGEAGDRHKQPAPRLRQQETWYSRRVEASVNVAAKPGVVEVVDGLGDRFTPGVTSETLAGSLPASVSLCSVCKQGALEAGTALCRTHSRDTTTAESLAGLQINVLQKRCPSVEWDRESLAQDRDTLLQESPGAVGGRRWDTGGISIAHEIHLFCSNFHRKHTFCKQRKQYKCLCTRSSLSKESFAGTVIAPM